MGELHQMQTEQSSLEQENKNLKRQVLQVQRAYLLQQRELNALQMEKVEAELKELS